LDKLQTGSEVSHLTGKKSEQAVARASTLTEKSFWRKPDDITKYLTEHDVSYLYLQDIHSRHRTQQTQNIQRYSLDCVKEGLDTVDMSTAKMKQTTATTASSAIDSDESGHL
jgi:hypothetical protein